MVLSFLKNDKPPSSGCHPCLNLGTPHAGFSRHTSMLFFSVPPLSSLLYHSQNYILDQLMETPPSLSFIFLLLVKGSLLLLFSDEVFPANIDRFFPVFATS